MRDTEGICALTRAKVVPGVNGKIAWLSIALKIERVRVKDGVACDGMVVPFDHDTIALPHNISVHRAMVSPGLTMLIRAITLCVDTVESQAPLGGALDKRIVHPVVCV